MSVGGNAPAGSSRIARLDPFALPARFPAADAAADERVRQIELHRERVVVRRRVGGIRMAVSLPVSMFLGVALRLVFPSPGSDGGVAVVLEHRDPALSITLFDAPDGQDALAEWRLWARVLGRPLLVCDEAGVFRPAFDSLGQVRVGASQPRRRRRTAVKTRRPRILMRRQRGGWRGKTTVHRGEREIVART